MPVDRVKNKVFENIDQKELYEAIMCQIWPKMAQNNGYFKFPVEISEIQKIYAIGI